MNKPFVSIAVITYNHEKYIANTIDGILAQECGFDYEIVIGEDCSTDGTLSILNLYRKKYPDLIRLITSASNVGMRANFSRTLIACNGDYIAVCEGDDYWIDKKKLQKQFDVLNKDCEVGLVYTKALIYIEDEKKYGKSQLGKKFKNNEVLISNPMATLTTMFRKELFIRYMAAVSPDERDWKMSDYPLWLWISFNTKVYFLEDITAVYRVLQGSASRAIDKAKRLAYNLSSFEIADFFAKQHCNKVEYDHFLYKRMLIIYLYCIKNGLKEKRDYARRLKTIKNKPFKSRILFGLINYLKIDCVYNAFFTITV